MAESHHGIDGGKALDLLRAHELLGGKKGDGVTVLHTFLYTLENWQPKQAEERRRAKRAV